MKQLHFDYFFEGKLCHIVIECDGSQHFFPCNPSKDGTEYMGGIKEFEKTKARDIVKNQFCIENGIKIIRIPFFCNKENEVEEILDFELFDIPMTTNYDYLVFDPIDGRYQRYECVRTKYKEHFKKEIKLDLV